MISDQQKFREVIDLYQKQNPVGSVDQDAIGRLHDSNAAADAVYKMAENDSVAMSILDACLRAHRTSKINITKEIEDEKSRRTYLYDLIKKLNDINAFLDVYCSSWSSEDIKLIPYVKSALSGVPNIRRIIDEELGLAEGVRRRLGINRNHETTDKNSPAETLAVGELAARVKGIVGKSHFNEVAILANVTLGETFKPITRARVDSAHKALLKSQKKRPAK